MRYFLLVIIVVILGYSTRRFSTYFPNWINLFLGDTLWALMIFFIFGLLFRKRATRWVTIGALLFSFSIEISQLYHSQWIDLLRQTRIGGLVLGYGFLWSDLVSYTVGIGAGVLIEKLMFHERQNKQLYESISRYVPYNEQEKKDKELIIYCSEVFEDVLTRKNNVAHMTSSAFAVNRAKDKVLMVHHNIYNSWSWIGGHADGEEDLLAVAMKELKEETGVKNIHPVSSDIFSLDVLTVLGHTKRGNYVSPHLHLSIAYLIEVDESDLLKVKEDENSGIKWIPIDELNIYSTETHMHKVYDKLISKTKNLRRKEASAEVD